MQPKWISFILGAILGLLAYGLATLLGASRFQAVSIGMWLLLVPVIANAIPAKLNSYGRTPTRRALSVIGLLTFYFIVFVLPSFGYRLDLSVQGIILILAFGSLLIRWFVPSRLFQLSMYTVLVLACGVVATSYISKCTIIACHALPWGQQVQTAHQILQQQAPGFLLDGVSVRPETPTPFWFGDQPNLRVRFTIVRATPADTNVSDLPYDIGAFSFNDLDPLKTLDLDHDYGRTSTTPNPRWQQELQQVRVGPRDVLAQTQQAGEAFLAHKIGSYDVAIRLYLADEVPTRLHVQGAWKATYSDLEQPQQLDLWIDAETGAVLEQSIQ